MNDLALEGAATAVYVFDCKDRVVPDWAGLSDAVREDYRSMARIAVGTYEQHTEGEGS